MCKKIIVLGLIIGLMGIGGLNRNSFAEEKMIEKATTELQDLKTIRVKEKIRAMQENEIKSQKSTTYQNQIEEAVGKEDIKKKQIQTSQMQESTSEIPVEEVEEVGRSKQVFSNEKVEEIKSKIEEEPKPKISSEELKPLKNIPPLTLGEQEEIKFNPSITKVILRAGGGADYITTHSGVSKKKYLVFEIYSIDSDSVSLPEVISKGKKEFSQQIQTNSDGSFEITYQSNKYQQGNYYLVVSGRNETKGGYKTIHFVRISPVSNNVIKQNNRKVEPVKPIINLNK